MFSFKINKKVSSTSAPLAQKSSVQQATSSTKAFQDEDDREDDEPDFIDGLEGTNILSKKKKNKEPKAALVIPLITKNEWRIDKKAEGEEAQDKDNEGSEVSSEKPPETLQDQAVKELLEEATSKKDTDKKNSKMIPILFQNRVPAGYEEDDNMDVSLRPDQSTLDDYEKIPIEEFGFALLRGMGWKETEGIGLKNKKVVDMQEPKLRPKGMGLGAEAAHLNKDVAPKNAATGNNEDKEDLSFKIGGYAVITRGSKKGHYGKIESFDEDNNRVIMKLGISGKMEAVSKFYIDVVSAKEYKKKSKVINSEKYEEYKAKQEEKERLRHEGNHISQDSDDDDTRRRKHKSESSDSDSEDNYRSRSKTKRNERERDYEYEEKSDKRYRDRDGDRGHKTSERSKDRKRDEYEKDRYSSSRQDSRRYDDRDKRDRNDDYYRNSSRNGDRRSDHHRSRKDDDRDRRRRD